MLDFARARGIAIISDEVYGTMVYDGSTHAPSFLQIADENDAVFVINSFSKPWAMTGWRIGWLTHPRQSCRNDAGPFAGQQHRHHHLQSVWRTGGADAGR